MLNLLGLAATSINGGTLAAFAGFADLEPFTKEELERLSKSSCGSRWRKARVLIIDEISMVDGRYFEKMNTLACYARRSNRPFGGIQIIVAGDFFQLSPVSRNNDCQYAFEAESWKAAITNIVELTQVFRQRNMRFINLLRDLRVGKITKEAEKILEATALNDIERHGIKPTILCAQNDRVERVNAEQLAAIDAEAKLFESVDSTSETKILRAFDRSFPVRQKLHLKVGAQVMLTKNKDVSLGLVNGARGVVTGFDTKNNLPEVQFLKGEKMVIAPETFSLKLSGDVMATRQQIPLVLAWAMSIHKSQGMSLDCVEVSLAGIFAEGKKKKG